MQTNSINNAGSAGISAKAAETAHGVVDKAAEAAAPAVNRLASSVHAKIDSAASAAGKLEERGEELVEASGRMLEAAKDLARSKPFVVLGVGLAAGLLIGRMMR